MSTVPPAPPPDSLLERALEYAILLPFAAIYGVIIGFEKVIDWLDGDESDSEPNP